MKPQQQVMKLEGALLKDPDPFSYFMLIAFEASGLLRFVLLLMTWPLVLLLRRLNMAEAALKLTIFVSLAGLPHSEILSVSRAVLPKFFMDDIDMDAWNTFDSSSSSGFRTIQTQMPTIMVETFATQHLLATHVLGTQLLFNRFGFSTGLTSHSSIKETPLPPSPTEQRQREQRRPLPVIFHDGRLVRRPTPRTALKIIFWIPLGILLALVRIAVGVMLPLWLVPHVSPLFGGKVIVKGKPPAASGDGSGVLFVCTHRTLMDPVVLSSVLQRRIPAVTYSISVVSEILSPIRTVRLTRVRHLDAEKIKQELEKGDLVVCPEGTTCREPFLLRFSAMFAELTDRIVPVGMNYRVGFFHATTARGWKGLDPVFFFMNPNPIYEVTFLNQLPAEATCGAGKSPHDVANYVQKLLAATLGFEATNFTRRDKYRLLAGNDGVVAAGNCYGTLLKKVVGALKPFFHQ